MVDTVLTPWSQHAALLIHVASTMALVGLIWTVQVVQYPLFAFVGEDFAAFHAQHSTRITFVVLPLMLAEAVTALWLVSAPPAGIPAAATWLGLALVIVIWLSTFAIQVPTHGALGRGFDGELHRILVVSNWLRTIAWTARGLLVLTWVAVLLRAPEVP